MQRGVRRRCGAVRRVSSHPFLSVSLRLPLSPARHPPAFSYTRMAAAHTPPQPPSAILCQLTICSAVGR